MLLGIFFIQKIIIRNCRKMSGWVEEKARYLNRSVDERLGNDAIALADVPSWTQYYNSNKESLADRPVQNLKSRFNIEDYTPNPELNSLVSVWRGDITKLAIDTIVNAANNRMLGGGGVDGAIHRAAGPLLKEECRTHNGCPTGEAKITGAYKLPSKYIIHTVGPVGEKPDLLVSSYKTSLELAVENQLRTIAFPCISTGVYGYPQSNAAVTVLKFTREFLETNPSKLDRIIFCVFLPEDVEIYESLLQVYFPVPSS